MNSGEQDGRRVLQWTHVAIIVVVIFVTMFLVVDAAAAAGYGKDGRVMKNLALTTALIVFVGFPTLIHAERRVDHAE